MRADPPLPSRRAVLVATLGGGLALAGCGGTAADRASETTPTSSRTSPPSSSSPPAGSSPPASSSAAASSSAPASPSPPASSSARAEVPDRLRLTNDRRNAFAFAPLSQPSQITVEGRVDALQAWSTSKVLVVAAFLDTVAGGDPRRLRGPDARLIEAALTASDGTAVNALRDQIPGRPGPAMTAVLRSIGDRSTAAPDSYQGLMPWSLREQVRFAAALDAGRVVSAAASRFLRDAMRPIRAHAWGLGRVGATAYKGGWLRADTATRQFGLLGGYAVALITTAGPAVRQTDGDSAHVEAMNRLAGLLAERLRFERSGRGPA